MYNYNRRNNKKTNKKNKGEQKMNKQQYTRWIIEVSNQEYRGEIQKW